MAASLPLLRGKGREGNFFIGKDIVVGFRICGFVFTAGFDGLWGGKGKRIMDEEGLLYTRILVPVARSH